MHEPLLERIRQLERSVSRWRLACALVIVVVSLVAIGGTFGVILTLQVPDSRLMEMQRADAEAARAREQQAMQAERNARAQAERALQAERAARQQIEGNAAAP